MTLQPGRLGYNPWRRSVYNRIQSAHVGTPDPDEEYARCHAAVAPVTLSLCTENLAVMTVCAASNELRARGVKPMEIRPSILLPEDTSEQELRHLIDALCAAASEEHMTIGSGHIEVTGAVSRMIISGSITGTETGQCPSHRLCPPGSAIVMTKWAGISGSYLMAVEKEEELSKYFPAAILRRMKQMRDELTISVESAAAAMSGAQTMLALSEGGIYTALWDLSQRTGTGLLIDLRMIPILQETIEFSNYYDIDPYQMSSEGSLLVIFNNDEQAMQYISCLLEKGIFASLIGHLTDNNDKIIRNGDEIRYLDRPRPDELLKIM